MLRTRRVRMLIKLLWLLRHDWKFNFVNNVMHTIDMFFIDAGKNVKWNDMYQQLLKDYENLMENGITDEMFLEK